MCGIAGILNFSSDRLDPRTIARMCDEMVHRGPDDAGYVFFDPSRNPSFIESTEEKFSTFNRLPAIESLYAHQKFQPASPKVMLGHRRLAVLDLSPKAHQPMSCDQQSVWLSYNGEIYNYRELRADLEKKGIAFQSHSDSEVLLQLWAKKGPACIPDLNGMFAFAVLDMKRRKLFLVRDRFGIKPLYFSRNSEVFVFASEIKGILASGLIEAQIDPQSLVEYFTFQNLLSHETLFQGVSILMPGRYLEIDLDKAASIKEHLYWQPEFSQKEDSFSEASDKLFHAFSRVIKRQLVSDVPVGSFLSGGMDSGSLVAVASRLIPHMFTFTVGFDMSRVSGIEQAFDERGAAEFLANHFQTEHYETVLHGGDMPQAMERLAWHLDDPRVGMCHPNWYASKLASRFVKVCLAGTGGDELFGGYPWRYQNAKHDSVQEFDQRYFEMWNRLLPNEDKAGFFNFDISSYLEGAKQKYFQIFDEYPTYSKEMDLPAYLANRAFYFEIKTFLHGLLVVEDRMSMAHSLETRVPFLDHDLVDLALQIPPQHKIDLQNSASEGKQVLRKAMESLLPYEHAHQRKQGFSPPDENWYRGPSMDYIKEILLDPMTQSRPFLNQKFVEGKLADHFEGRNNNRLLIWSLLCFEWLQRHFFDGNSSKKAIQLLPERKHGYASS